MVPGPWLTFPEAYGEIKGQVKGTPVLVKGLPPAIKESRHLLKITGTSNSWGSLIPHLCLSATHVFWTGGLEFCFLVLFPATNCWYVLVPTWLCSSNSSSNDMLDVSVEGVGDTQLSSASPTSGKTSSHSHSLGN